MPIKSIARMRLGQKTSTADAEGEVIEERPVPDFDLATIDAVLSQNLRGTHSTNSLDVFCPQKRRQTLI
jgi:hypothetical protein